MAIAPHLRNPYIIGRPIDEPELFFGRESLFEFIEDNLVQGSQVLLLHGQRRIGKSSVLKQIPNFIALDRYLFVSLSLEGKSQKPLDEVLFELGRDILDQLNLLDTLIFPEQANLRQHTEQYAESFWIQLWEKLGNRRLVLLLDEFDALGDLKSDQAIAHLFPYLQSTIQVHKRLFLIPVIGRRLEDLPRLRGLFKEAPSREVGLLDRRSAERLIRKPAERSLDYDSNAVDVILNLTAGHPYFTQVVCFALFANARESQRWRVTKADVDSIVERAIEIGEGGLSWFRDGLPVAERVVYSAVADIQAEARDDDPLVLLQERGVIQIEVLQAAREQLLKWGFLSESKPHTTLIGKLFGKNASQRKLKVTVELVCRWLAKRYPVKQEIRELEKLNPEADDLFQQLSMTATLDHRLETYEKILELNPDHFNTLFALAETRLDLAESKLYLSDYEAAVDLLTRAAKVDSLRVRDRLFHALLGYGRELLRAENMQLAIVQFRQASDLDPDKPLVQSLMQVIYQGEMGATSERDELRKLKEVFGIVTAQDYQITLLPKQQVSIEQANTSAAELELEASEEESEDELEAPIVPTPPAIPAPVLSKRQVTKPPEKIIHSRYRIKHLLGTSGLSETYLAADIYQGNRPVIIKQFNFETADEEFLREAKDNFFAELDVIKILGNSDRIPQILDYFDEEKALYLVQQYIEGQPLSAELKHNPKWSEPAVIQFLMEILAILIFVHGCGVIHRDIKPRNLVRRDRDQKFVLLDFFGGGIKQFQGRAISDDSSFTLTIGAKAYTAPEQLTGRAKPSSDIYSLGMIAIQALTGVSPNLLYTDPDTFEIVWRDRAQVSDQLADIISKMAHYSFRDRYQNAVDVLEDLQEL
jgi:tetratricopeptide (TPR) repeat protein